MNQNKSLPLREIQALSLQILLKIHEICTSQNITYFLFYGSLIGAIRHHGFIPWDDDLDIAMPREDFLKFKDYCSSNQNCLLPYKLLDSENTKDYPYELTRICDTRYRLVAENEKECGLGVFVDVYVIDGLGNDFRAALAKKKTAAKLSSLAFLSTRDHLAKDNTKGTLKMMTKVPAYLVAKLVGKNFFFKRLRKYSELNKYSDSEYVANIVWSTSTSIGIFRREWFQESIEVEFEGYHFKAPVGYHELLKQLYGDYMILPPEAARVQQHFYRIYKR